jgi:hypothetical protein
VSHSLHLISHTSPHTPHQPQTWVNHSTQGIYLAIMNLPRHLRYRRENMILVGLIPVGESVDLDGFMTPMVDELLDLYKPVDDPTRLDKKVGRRAALLCVACDMPAVCKVGGFAYFDTTVGCHRCTAVFEKTHEGRRQHKPNFGADILNGVEREQRTHEDHLAGSRAYKEAKTVDERTEAWQATGCKHTDLLRLPYIDLPRFCIIDPLHNM